MDITTIQNAMVEALRAQLRWLGTVEPYAGNLAKDIGSMAVRYPAVFVMYEASEGHALDALSPQEVVRLRVLVASRDFKAQGRDGRAGAHNVLSEVKRVLAGSDLGLGIARLEVVSTSLVQADRQGLIYAIEFGTGLYSDTGAKPITAHLNLLESSTVTLCVGQADPLYPIYRLYDRHPARMFKSDVAQSIAIKIDQGAAGAQSVDTLLIPSGHELAGMTLDLMASDDDVTYAPVVAQWQAAEGVIHKSWQALTRRYWKLTVTDPATAPAIAELFLTSAYQWERGPVRPVGPTDAVLAVAHEQTSTGGDRFLVAGPVRMRRVYKVHGTDEAQAQQMRLLHEAWAGARPFWLCDHEGQWIFGRLANAMELTERAYKSHDFEFHFIEVLS